MAQTTVSVRMDSALKKDFDIVCKELGLTMSTAITILAKKMVREERLPFEMSLDPFYSKSNMEELKKRIEDVNTGKSILKEHELIEADE